MNSSSDKTMLVLLQTIFSKKTHSKLNEIQKIDGLLDWIDDHCHPALLREDCPQDNIIAKKYFSIMHPDEPVQCKNNQWLKFCNNRKILHCTRQCGCFIAGSVLKGQATSLQRYGVNHPAQNPEIKSKQHETNIKKYGVRHSSQSELVKQKQKQTNLTKYGVENVFQSPEIQLAIASKNLEKYGVKFPTQNKQVSGKIKNTCLKKYGVDNVGKVPDVQRKMKSSCVEKYGTDNALKDPQIRKQCQHTMQTRYGVDNPMKSDNIRQQTRKTMLEKYGVDNAFKSQVIKQKIREKNIEKYGTPSFQQRHIPQASLEILADATKFENMLLMNGLDEMAKILGVSVTTIYTRHNKLGLNIIQPFSSLAESEICQWLVNLNLSVETHNRKLCAPYEIDIYIPSHNLAIEFDGLYWHSEEKISDKNYHINKTAQCTENGIHLIHIFEDEWKNHKEICKSIILNHLSLTPNKIAGRACKIEEISNKQAKIFLECNHLQGYVAAALNLALVHNNEIISIMTFGKPRYNKQAEWELLRLANKCDTVIVGGATKLWSYFIKTTAPVQVVSYCDRRWFTGSLYAKLGFERKIISTPSYWYTDYIKRFHRSRFTKKNAINAALLLDEMYTNDQLKLLTEKQIVKEILGLERIWDCGQDVWRWQK